MMVSELQVEINCGDIILFSRPCSEMDIASTWICYGAKFFGWTEWDHLGLVIQNPETQQFYLLEANINGITCHPLIERLQRSKSRKLAVRKLTIQPSAAHNQISEHDIFLEFRQKLWQLCQLYLKKRYNNSFFQMADAMIASYSQAMLSANTSLPLKQQLVVLKEQQVLLSSHINHRKQRTPSLQSSLLNRFIEIKFNQNQSSIRKLEEDIDSFEGTFPRNLAFSNLLSPSKSKNSPTALSNSQSGSENDGSLLQDGVQTSPDTKSEEYYCSQLVAEIFMEMKILANHRYPYQYIPADFSSSTLFKGFVTHSYDSFVVDDTSSESIEKRRKYLYSPDIVIPDKRHMSFLTAVENGQRLVWLSFPLFHSADNNSSALSKNSLHLAFSALFNAPAMKDSYCIPFHSCNLLPISVLSKLFETDQIPEVTVNGDLRVYVRSRQMALGDNREPVLISVFISPINQSINVSDQLHSIYQQYHDRCEIFLSALQTSSLTIQNSSGPTTLKENTDGAQEGNVHTFSLQNEVIRVLFATFLDQQPAARPVSDQPIIESHMKNMMKDLLLQRLRPGSFSEEESEVENQLERFYTVIGSEIIGELLKKEDVETGLLHRGADEAQMKQSYQKILLILLSVFFNFLDFENNQNLDDFSAALHYYLESNVFTKSALIERFSTFSKKNENHNDTWQLAVPLLFVTGLKPQSIQQKWDIPLFMRNFFAFEAKNSFHRIRFGSWLKLGSRQPRTTIGLISIIGGVCIQYFRTN